jgi:signal recognition particle GTPase
MNRILPSIGKWFTTVVVIGGVFLIQPVAAQQAAPGAEPNAQMQAFMQKRAELQKLQKQLAQIQQQTIDKRPALQKQQQEFRKLMITKMKAKGYNPEKDINHLKELEAELNGKDVDAQKRKDLMIDLRETSMKLQKGQQEIMQDKDVQASRTSLIKAVLKGMHEDDSRTEPLIKQAHQTEMELVAIQRQINGTQADPSPKAH